MCEQEIVDELFKNEDDPIQKFTDILLGIADKTVPKTSKKPKRRDRPWFNDNCKEAIRERKQALRHFSRNPTTINHDTYKLFRAKARRTFKQNKKRSWRDHVSQLNSSSSIKKTWDMIRKISGKGVRSAVSHLIKDGDTVTEHKDIANTLGESFSKNSSSEHYAPKFQKFKRTEERKRLNFRSKNLEKYNRKFSLKELLNALRRSHNSAPGPDKIHYQFLKQLPMSCFKSSETFSIEFGKGASTLPAGVSPLLFPSKNMVRMKKLVQTIVLSP